MSKSLASMTDYQKKQAIIRRCGQSERGLGFWSAIDALSKKLKENGIPFIHYVDSAGEKFVAGGLAPSSDPKSIVKHYENLL